MHDSSRRDILRLGSSLFGMLWLAGCASSGDLPDPVWSQGPITPGPAPLPPIPNLPPAPGPAPRPAGVPQVIARSAWTRKGPNLGDINPMGGVRRITIHHDGMDTFTATSPDAAARRLEQIRSSHVTGRRWADIGYHYVIDPAGRVWEGRATKHQGAHVQDNNENNLGILCMGNFDRQSPSDAQLRSLDRFVASQMRLYRVPLSRVYTHSELNASRCPGRNMQQYMNFTRSRNGALALALATSGDATLLA